MKSANSLSSSEPARSSYDGEVGLLELADGRSIFWHQYGPPGGFPVFYFHGTPGSGIEGAAFEPAARRQGVRLIAVDRPGVGNSDPLPGRLVADWPGDVAQVATHLGLHDYSVFGWSGGGPHALVCGAHLSENLRAVGLVSPQGRYSVEAGQMPKFTARLWMPAVRILALIPRLGTGIFGAAFRFADARRSRRAGSTVHKDVFARSLKFSQHRHRHGAIHDNDALLDDWGASLPQMASTLEQLRPPLPITIWQGLRDTSVKPAATRELADALPHTTLITDPFATHLDMLLDHTDEVLRVMRRPRASDDGTART